MASPLGFVLITHEKPRQIRRLVERLGAMFEGPPIVCHHNFSLCPLDVADFPANVSFVCPHLETEWAGFSVVEATVRAIGQLYSSPQSPDWFVLLSGADYPIKPAERVLADLAASPFDAHIHHEPIRAERFDREWQQVCFDRYCNLRVSVPGLSRNWEPKWRTITLRSSLLRRMLLPFSPELRCYAGGQWFTANRRAAQAILEFHHARPELAAHYRTCRFAEESYFQTILANTPCLALTSDNLRYTDWRAGGSHPKSLRLSDLPALMASNAHFARKVDLDRDDGLVEELDAGIRSLSVAG